MTTRQQSLEQYALRRQSIIVRTYETSGADHTFRGRIGPHYRALLLRADGTTFRIWFNPNPRKNGRPRGWQKA